MIKVISATNRDYKSTLLYNSYKDVTFIEKNTEALSKVYNKAYKQHSDQQYDWFVFVHDDVILEAPLELPEKLVKLGEQYDVIGCAGIREIKLQQPALWHLMGDRQHYRGAVAHLSGDKKMMTSFGPYPDRVILIDGVFMAFKSKVLQNVQFDEENPAKFHFYDLDMSLTCHNNGFKVGVGDIPITHASPGLREYTSEWLKGQEWFLNKHSKQ